MIGKARGVHEIREDFAGLLENDRGHLKASCQSFGGMLAVARRLVLELGRAS
jgi:hypothetical protein